MKDKNRLTQIFAFVFGYFLWNVLLFGCWTFGNAEINPATWSVMGRGTFALLGPVFGIFIGLCVNWGAQDFFKDDD